MRRDPDMNSSNVIVHRLCCQKLLNSIIPSHWQPFMDLREDGTLYIAIGASIDRDGLSLQLKAATYCPYCGHPRTKQTLH